MITAVEFIQGGLKQLHGNLEKQLDNITPDQLHAVPAGNPKANTIAWGLWHYVRTEDNVVQYILQNKKTPIWIEGGYAAKTGLPEMAQGTGMPTAEAQALRIKDQHGYNTIKGETVGAVLPVDWVRIPDPDRPEAEFDARVVQMIARERGAARFLSGEGATMVGNSVVFDSSDGGDAGLGQIWKYTPTTNIGDLDEEGELELLYESTDRKVLDGPDNLCTSPNNRIVIAEDGKENNSFVRGLRNNGTIVNVAQNLVPMRLSIIDASGKLYDPYVPDDGYSASDGLAYSEFAGPRFSPDGTWLFVNIQVPGITCAITGDWASLGL